MTTTLTGKIINGNYINAPRRSCKPYDYPTEERVTVELDGKTYERTIYERVTWRNSAKSSVSARFVIINGTNYEVAKVEEYDEMGMEMNAWERVGDLGELQDGNGNSLVYGEFGSGTYGLYTTIDGEEACLCVSGTEDADSMLEKIASGWRPVNWNGGNASA